MLIEPLFFWFLPKNAEEDSFKTQIHLKGIKILR
jgi:hypothetical protein